MNVSNVLSEEKKKQVIALGQLGWTLRRIEKETGVRRETAAGYLKAARISVRSSGRWGHGPPATPASKVTTDPGSAKSAIGDANSSTSSKPAIEVTTDFGDKTGPPVLAAANPEPFRECL